MQKRTAAPAISILYTARTILFLISAVTLAEICLSSQTSQGPKPSFDVISIKPSGPVLGGVRGGGARGNRYTMTGVTLRVLLQNGYPRMSPGVAGQLQIVGAPSWIDSERYDIQATMDCSSGPLSREQVQLMVQSMLEDRFQLKAHMEIRELPVYNLVVAKDGPKIKASADQSPPPLQPAGPPQYCGPESSTPPSPPSPFPRPGQRGSPTDPNFVMPRGSTMMMFNQTGATLFATAVPIPNIINMLQPQAGRPIIDKTELKGLFDFKLQFSPEGLNLPTPFGGIAAPAGAAPSAGGGGSSTPPAAADPIPSLFTAIQELGLKLESSKGPVNVLVVDSVQKPKES